MTQLSSTKNINKFKIFASKNGGYQTHINKMRQLCWEHFCAYGTDLFPKQLGGLTDAEGSRYIVPFCP